MTDIQLQQINNRATNANRITRVNIKIKLLLNAIHAITLAVFCCRETYLLEKANDLETWYDTQFIVCLSRLALVKFFTIIVEQYFSTKYFVYMVGSILDDSQGVNILKDLWREIR